MWPSAFYTEPDGAQVLNTSLLVSATEVSPQPQTVVYQINPRAVWSDGTPVSYADFVYNWQAQSGQSRFTDVGRKPYTPADEAGYADIAKVTGNPAAPYTATVVFSSPYPDWRSLFSYLVPAHVGQAIGFSSGFTDPVADLVSAGPYLVSQLHPGYSLELVRNAGYWGPPANLASITYYFTSTLTEMLNALGGHELGVATVPADLATYQQLQAAGGLSVLGVASASYEDLEFNEASPTLSSPVLRQAIMMAVDRTTMVADVLTPFGVAATPVENRFLLPGEPGYDADGSAYDKPNPTAALALLAAHGYKLSDGALHGADGQAVSLSLLVASDDPVAQELGAQIVGSCAAIGVAVTLVQGAPAPSGARAPGRAQCGRGAHGPGPALYLPAGKWRSSFARCRWRRRAP